MHSHDRTLIQQLGADLDHKTKEHDLACLYLQANALEIVKRYVALPEPDSDHYSYPKQCRTYLERVITKGTGEYRSHVGFIDLLILFNFMQGRFEIHSGGYAIVIEVKTRPTPIGDIIRQIKLYRTYTRLQVQESTYWILATTYHISELEREALLNEDIEWLPISSAYKDFDRGLARGRPSI